MPSVGIFIFYYDELRNYTEASNTCGENHDGFLANVLSDARTNYLSFLVKQHNNDFNKNSVIYEQNTNRSDSRETVPIRHAFVGLREVRIKGRFLDSNSVPIQCFRYRAWQPRYPK